MANEAIIVLPENAEDGVLQICVALDSDGELETDLIVTMMTFDGLAGEAPLSSVFE